MKIELPDINFILDSIQPVRSTYDEQTKTISHWVAEHRKNLTRNEELIGKKSDSNDIKIMVTLLNDLLMRNMIGESGEKIKQALKNHIMVKSDLSRHTYKRVINQAQYRWGDVGVDVMDAVVRYFRDELDWTWESYFADANKHYQTNFTKDPLLKIKHIKYKVRDLALSNFNFNYIANDLHIVRVSTRLGLLNYGFPLLSDPELEMGNNPSNVKNYLFLHKLFLKLSDITGGKWKLADFDRTFWHFGRTICDSSPKCEICPLHKVCLSSHYHK